ncbi:hypothetical protein FGO68_gene1570 [Halteria grandinella]|uniref:SET domain-containing protein n=1 Tax=Halteria grandinella TaxID=5974 RepID=A0A8J8T7R8_HALGN|nr:hypothetical protein FGO68_gene1570 [Halteria grandinella]
MNNLESILKEESIDPSDFRLSFQEIKQRLDEIDPGYKKIKEEDVQVKQETQETIEQIDPQLIKQYYFQESILQHLASSSNKQDSVLYFNPDLLNQEFSEVFIPKFANDIPPAPQTRPFFLYLEGTQSHKFSDTGQFLYEDYSDIEHIIDQQQQVREKYFNKSLSQIQKGNSVKSFLESVRRLICSACHKIACQHHHNEGQKQNERNIQSYSSLCQRKLQCFKYVQLKKYNFEFDRDRFEVIAQIFAFHPCKISTYLKIPCAIVHSVLRIGGLTEENTKSLELQSNSSQSNYSELSSQTNLVTIPRKKKQEQSCRCHSTLGQTCNSDECPCFRGYCDPELCKCSHETCARMFKGCEYDCKCEEKDDCPCFREQLVCNPKYCDCRGTNCTIKYNGGKYKFAVSESQIPDSGQGLFALDFIPKDALIGIYIGELINGSNDKHQYQIRSAYKEFHAPSYIYDIENPQQEDPLKGFIDAANFGNYMRFANHNSTGKKLNVKCDIKFLNQSKLVCAILFVALQDIREGSELYINYGSAFFSDQKSLKQKEKQAQKRTSRNSAQKEVPISRTISEQSEIESSQEEQISSSELEEMLPRKGRKCAQYDTTGEPLQANKRMKTTNLAVRQRVVRESRESEEVPPPPLTQPQPVQDVNKIQEVEQQGQVDEKKAWKELLEKVQKIKQQQNFSNGTNLFQNEKNVPPTNNIKLKKTLGSAIKSIKIVQNHSTKPKKTAVKTITQLIAQPPNPFAAQFQPILPQLPQPQPILQQVFIPVQPIPQSLPQQQPFNASMPTPCLVPLPPPSQVPLPQEINLPTQALQPAQAISPPPPPVPHPDLISMALQISKQVLQTQEIEEPKPTTQEPALSFNFKQSYRPFTNPGDSFIPKPAQIVQQKIIQQKFAPVNKSRPKKPKEINHQPIQIKPISQPIPRIPDDQLMPRQTSEMGLKQMLQQCKELASSILSPSKQQVHGKRSLMVTNDQKKLVQQPIEYKRPIVQQSIMVDISDDSPLPEKVVQPQPPIQQPIIQPTQHQTNKTIPAIIDIDDDPSEDYDDNLIPPPQQLL